MASLRQSQTPETTESATVLRLAHEYAQLFAEYRRRSDYRPYSVRHRFDQMSDSDVEQALHAARERLTTRALTVRDQPAQDPTYLLAVIEHSAHLEARGELNERQRQYWSECRTELLRLARSRPAGPETVEMNADLQRRARKVLDRMFADIDTDPDLYAHPGMILQYLANDGLCIAPARSAGTETGAVVFG